MARKQTKPAAAPDSGATLSRLFALAVGTALLIGGVAGFFYEPSFGTGSELETDDILSRFPTNGWDNTVGVIAGLAGLLLASRAARPYALGLGTFFVALAIWGFAVEDGGSTIADLLPIDRADNLLHLLVGAAGVAAGLVDGRGEPIAGLMRRLSHSQRRGGGRPPGTSASEPG